MKRIAFVTLAILTSACSGSKKTTPDAVLTSELRSLYANKQCFELRDVMALNFESMGVVFE